MADFKFAYLLTLKHEGGYVDDPDDSGGETYRGIARKFWPDWQGWALVDRIKKVKLGSPGKTLTDRKIWALTLDRFLHVDKELQALIETFYRQNFWKKEYELIRSQVVANWLFDKSVNMGIRPATKLVQIGAGVTADGILGMQTILAINAADEAKLMPKIRQAGERYYRSIVARKPEKKKFLNGWLKRL